MEDARASLFRSTKGDIMLFWRSEVEDIYLMLKLKFGGQTRRAERVKVSGSNDLKDEVIFVGDGRKHLDFYVKANQLIDLRVVEPERWRWKLPVL
ncbi:hypothetical protein ACFX13_010980 [Malus domestica]